MMFGLLALFLDLLVTSTFYLLWLGLGAILVGAVMLLAPEIPIVAQIGLWGVFSIVSIAGWISFRKKFERIKNPDTMVGINCIVLNFDSTKGRGRVRFQRPYGGSDVWDAVSEDEIKRRETATVTGVDAKSSIVTISKKDAASGRAEDKGQ